MPSSAEHFTFPDDMGGDIAAQLDKPDGTPKHTPCLHISQPAPTIFFAASHVAKGLTDAGIAVLRFNLTGLRASEGETININFSSKVCNLVAATNHILKHLSAPSVLIGHSLGGEAVLATAG